MLYIMIAYLMLLASIINAVCLYNASFLGGLLTFANAQSMVVPGGALVSALVS